VLALISRMDSVGGIALTSRRREMEDFMSEDEVEDDEDVVWGGS